ncbi:uncharacterized protein NAREPO1_02310 [endosymbiont of Euscepes postfasciatus]|uniref:peptidoglycan DD-metalloendopeptidase family protein n=1 Tax=endosymbiont of Euscepes postfasciatus TaxID=650377 RepID=UPI000DC6E9D6|nr:peptidoglycan DD-metalloendopeptidase family protein [endosymbiont of Euscepes postfasciatus]BBA84739.1 uncharacterized protein NAREPO1_02310 [endosymbiont of Euscepes postfasciatus]
MLKIFNFIFLFIFIKNKFFFNKNKTIINNVLYITLRNKKFFITNNKLYLYKSIYLIKYNLYYIFIFKLINFFFKLKLICNNSYINNKQQNNIKKVNYNNIYKKCSYDFIKNNFKIFFLNKVINDNNYLLINFIVDENFINFLLKLGIKNNDIYYIINIIKKCVNLNSILKKKCFLLLETEKYNNYLYKYRSFLLIKFNIKNKSYIVIKKNNKFNLIILKLKNKFIGFPVKDKFKISSKFNLQRLNPITNKLSPHKGIDIAVPLNTPIFSVDFGIIIEVSYNKYAGNYVIIKHNDKYTTKYMHLDKIFVYKNKLVKKNELIGLSGNSGKSTGPHLHFEFWINNIAVDPIKIYFYYFLNNIFKIIN